MLKLLIITDMHYAVGADRSTIASRRGDLAVELIERIRARRHSFDAVCVLGDVIENGRSAAAEVYWQSFLEVLRTFDRPLIALPGNHDREPARFASIFGKPVPMHINGCTLIPFWDHYDEKDVCTRDLAAMEQALSRADGPIIVLQHSTILPAIESSYPYTLPQHLDIADAYTRYGVTLSLSGHFHTGISPFTEGGVTYAAVPALCESPFRYALVTVGDDGQVTMEVLELGEI